MSDNESSDQGGLHNEDDSLYGDIHTAVKDAEIERLHRELFEKEKENAILREELEQIRSQLNLIVHEKEILETNFMTLYNTAVREIKRKDRELTERSKASTDKTLIVPVSTK